MFSLIIQVYAIEELVLGYSKCLESVYKFNEAGKIIF